METALTDRETNLMGSLTETSWRGYLWIGALSAVVLWGLFAYIQQLRYGLIVTGMRDQVSWGLYITNFVFFIGISHVGALLSAILRFSGAEWRRPLTRMAEAITTASLFIGGLMPLIDMGRPDRILNLFIYGRIQSPMVWDIIAIVTYFTGSTLFLWALLIPDIALLRDIYPRPARWRKKLYEFLALRYRGTPEQRRYLERAILAVTLVILPLAISVHTVVAWVFAMTLRPGWDSTIFGPYFVAGALYSGAASVILAMYVFRRVYRLEAYLKPLHFRKLGFVLLALTMLYLYFNINEYLTLGYKFAGHEKHLLERFFYGDLALPFWTVQGLGVLIPFLLLVTILGWKREFTVQGITLASLLVVAFSWAKRYLIIIPTLGSPYLPMQNLPWEWAHYFPTWVEWSITAGGFAAFLLIYTILSKLFPIVSIWETREEPVEIKVEEPEFAVQPLPRRWKFVRPFTVVLLVGGLATASSASAEQAGEGKAPLATRLLLEWEALPPTAAPPSGEEESDLEQDSSPRVYLFADQIFGRLPLGASQKQPEAPPHPISVTARLLDVEGRPLAFQPVQFGMQTLFGTLSFGARATDEEGEAQLIIRDRRYGNGPIQVRYQGDETLAASFGEILVDFGPRPPPALPAEGVLITPYATAAISLSFLAFYGTIWVVFLYAFGYLMLWRMLRTSLQPRDLPLAHNLPAGPAGEENR